ncbi:MAG: HAD-IA family hydrolase [Loktanella sp.]|nr:HAD-IA family hydrolase [Loktanella sp.]
MLDVDGVLISGRPVDGAHWTSGLEKDLGISPESLTQHFFLKYWDDIQIGRSNLRSCLAKALADMKTQVEADNLIRYWFYNDSRVDHQLFASCSTLRKHGHRVYLVSNQDHERAAYIMNELGLSQHVDGLIYSAAIGVGKPSPAFFEAAEEASGALLSEILFIDDTAENVAAANACGWTAHLWTGGERLERLIQLQAEAGPPQRRRLDKK